MNDSHPIFVVRPNRNKAMLMKKMFISPAATENLRGTNTIMFQMLTLESMGTELGVTPVIIRGEELKQKGFGGTIYGVGKAVVNPPALAVLSHKPDGATQTIAWVGKGIVYDTGGLRIKGKAAAILGAFKATVNQGFKDNLHAVFCLAENAVGPTATRPDDIHTLYSGKSMEINNTDAEGRLVLSDGVVYASKDLSADIILDMATLTGAQVCDGWPLEPQQCSFGNNTRLHYFDAPHFFNHLLSFCTSEVDRKNATSSCAGLFIGSHVGFDWPGVWVHVDIASPVHAGERTTDFGVTLLMALFSQASDDPMLNLVSPLGAATMNAASRDPMEHDCKWRRLV
uniref:Cytosol aminopeptidase domain-containing protein n=1 Tax=Oncorhynchus tshawytscha TaxID=74940 RepID=A0A8C8BTQ0_ONCTS